MHFAGYPAAVDRLRALCDAHGLALIEDAAHAPSADFEGRKLGTWGLAGAFSFFSNKILSCGEGGLLATDDDAVAALARSLRSQAMTSGTWSRETRETDSYDVVGLGYNYRLDEPRSALLLSRLARLEPEIERRRELTRAYRAQAGRTCPHVLVPYDDASVERSSCYVMPILVDDDGRRDAVRAAAARRRTASRPPSSIPPCTSSRPTGAASACSTSRRPSASRAPRSRSRCSPTSTSRRRTAWSARSARRSA